MTVKEFIAALQICIQDEFIALSEVKENTIRVQFIDGQLINITITGRDENEKN